MTRGIICKIKQQDATFAVISLKYEIQNIHVFDICYFYNVLVTRISKQGSKYLWVKGKKKGMDAKITYNRSLDGKFYFEKVKRKWLMTTRNQAVVGDWLRMWRKRLVIEKHKLCLLLEMSNLRLCPTTLADTFSLDLCW